MENDIEHILNMYEYFLYFNSGSKSWLTVDVPVILPRA